MKKQCKKCGHIATVTDLTPTSACPQCGAVYAKVEARLAADATAATEAQQAALVTARRAREEAQAAAERERAQAQAQAERALRTAHVCTDCGSVGRPITITPGSIFIEIPLWLAFLVPGLIYSIWRHTSRYRACPICRHPSMIPAATPRAAQLIRELNLTIG